MKRKDQVAEDKAAAEAAEEETVVAERAHDEAVAVVAEAAEAAEQAARALQNLSTTSTHQVVIAKVGSCTS